MSWEGVFWGGFDGLDLVAGLPMGVWLEMVWKTDTWDCASLCYCSLWLLFFSLRSFFAAFGLVVTKKNFDRNIICLIRVWMTIVLLLW